MLNRFVNAIIHPAIFVVFSAGFFMFIWGLVQFLRSLDESSDRSEGVQHMIWGVVGMLIMVSVKALIIILSNTFGLGVITPSGDIAPSGPYNDPTRAPDTSKIQFFSPSR